MVTKTMGQRLTFTGVASWFLWILSVMLAATVYKFSYDLSFRETLTFLGYVLLFRVVVLGLPAYAIWKFTTRRRD